MITLALYPAPKSTTFSPSPASPSPSTASPTPTAISIAAAIPLLISYLDTFHQDADAWSLLADLYLLSTPFLSTSRPLNTTHASWGIDALWAEGTVLRAAFGKAGEGYTEQAMECLAQRVLLEPWEWKVLVQFAEIGILNGFVAFPSPFPLFCGLRSWVGTYRSRIKPFFERWK